MKTDKRRYENVDVTKLISCTWSARTHSDEQIIKIGASIREFAFIDPILIDASSNIIAGHVRIEATILEGFQELPCIFVETLSE